MTNKKGIDGTYYAVCLLLGLIIGIGLMYFAISKGYISCELLGCATQTIAPVI